MSIQHTTDFIKRRGINLRNTAVVITVATVSAAMGAIALPPFLMEESNQVSASTSGPSAETLEEILAAHNRYRSEVGVGPLVWSDTLATSAQDWANHLATTDTFAHSASNDYGENLWKGTAGAFSATQMVDTWGSEQQYFIDDAPFPDVSTTGNWSDVGHYTQLVWEETTEVGCALATGNGWDVLVCQYDPPGNFIGEHPF